MIPKLSVPILASILILGVLAVGLSFDDAEAKKTQFTTPQVGDEIEIKARGTGICTSGENSDTAKANTRFLLLVQETEGDSFTGVAKAKIKLQTKCEGTPKQLTNAGALAFTALSNSINISGDLIARDGTMFKLNSAGEYLTLSNGKTTIDMDLAIVSDPGVGVTLEIQIDGAVVTKQTDTSTPQ